MPNGRVIRPYVMVGMLSETKRDLPKSKIKVRAKLEFWLESWKEELKVAFWQGLVSQIIFHAA